MTNDQKTDSLKEKIVQAIETGKVHMRPKWRFVANTAALLFGVILALLILFYLASFIVFISHKSGAWFAPAFGLRGLYIFLTSFPWLIMAVAALFIFAVLFLIRKYAFAYGRPLLYSSLIVIALVIIAGFAIAQTSLHKGLFLMAQDEHLPFAGRLYRENGLMGRPGNIISGVIVEMIDDGFNMESRRDEVVTVVITPQTRLPFGADFEPGDAVVVLGDREDNKVRAFGIREIDKEEIMEFPRQQIQFKQLYPGQPPMN